MSARAPFKPDSKLVTHVRPAVNVEARKGGAKPSLLILHYTGMPSAAKAINWLACEESRVSCHYVIDEAGIVTQMVPEFQRAWHAGVSSWHGETDINSHSIGIEIQNPGHQHGYPDFPAAQMKAVLKLGKDIARRHRIKPERVLAHSDIAPERKIDPGEKFAWGMLARAGLGLWVRPSPVVANDAGLGSQDAPKTAPKGVAERVRQCQRLLSAYGYGVVETGVLDKQTEMALRAFQLHFRPRRVDGRLDLSTERTLLRLCHALKTKLVA